MEDVMPYQNRFPAFRKKNHLILRRITIAWNLIKPVLASELNHVAKDIQTSAGIIICATNGMKKAGNFDSAVGSYEKFLRYLLPLQNMLPTPILIIGLDAPDSFHVDKTSRQIVMHRA